MELTIMYLSKKQILEADDLKTETVNVPQWGGDVMVKAMTGWERDLFEGSLIEHKKSGNTVKTENIRAKLVQKTVIDPETKKALFTTAELEALGNKSASALDKIFNVARKLSGLSDEDIEELEKN